MTSEFVFHSEAAKAIDRRGEELFGLLRPLRGADNDPFESRRLGFRLDAEAIVGDVLITATDFAGDPIGRGFVAGNQVVGLEGDGYVALRGLAEEVTKAKWCRDAVGLKTSEAWIFDWARKHRDHGVTLSQYLVEAASLNVKPYTVLVPIAYTEVEQEFQFGRVSIVPLLPDLFDAFEVAVGQPLDDLRKRLQGLGAVKVELNAERGFAQESAIDIAKDCIALLRLFSPVTLTSRLVSPSVVLGSEFQPSSMCLAVGPDALPILTETSDLIGPLPWKISAAEVERARRDGLDEVSALLFADALTPFQQTLRTSLLTYSRSLTLVEPHDRLVFTFSALEGLLLRNDSEPITQNLAERIAFVLEQSRSRRLATVTTIKAAYKMRSEYMHHARKLQERATMEEFSVAAYRLLQAAWRNSAGMSSKEQFLDDIDNIKFGSEM